MSNKIKITLLLCFAILPIFVVFLDLLMEVVVDKKEILNHDFDSSFSNQVQYFSVWNAVMTTIWASAVLISFKTKRIGVFSSHNVEIMIVVQSLVVMILFFATGFIDLSQIPGLDTSHGIFKSFIEHLLLPILLVIYFIFNKEKREYNVKKFAKNQCFYSTILPTAYVIYALTRVIMLKEYSTIDDQLENHIDNFPYSFISPYANGKIGPLITTICIFAFISGSYGLNLLFYYFKIKLYANSKIKFVKVLTM